MKTPHLTILFWLNATTLIDGHPTIYCRLTISGKRAEISLQRSVPKEYWSRGQVEGKSQQAREINDRLVLFRADVLKHFDAMKLRGELITPDALKSKILGTGGGQEPQKSFADMTKLMNKEFGELVKAKKRSGKTLKRHEISQGFFTKFLEEQKKTSDVLLEKLNLSYCYDFEHYLSIKCEQSHNTYMKHIKNVKQVLDFAVKKCQLDKNPFKSFRCSYIEPKVILLEQHEIDTIWKHPMPITRLQQVRDAYVFCCYTAYAFSDVMALTMDNIVMSIDRELWLCKDRTKTETAENVMLLPIPKEVIEKYNDHPCRKQGFLLPQISLQNYNAYLKEIATLCGINKELTSHTARFTFATTVTLENDVPIESVSKMMGHKSIRTTQRYAKVTKKKLTNNMQQLRGKLLVASDPGIGELQHQAV
jgi:site-specific recombinase XerD